MPFWFGTCPFVFPFYLFFLIKTIGLSVKRQGVRRECLPPNICIHNGLWNEDTWWSDGRGGGLQGMREQFSSLLFLMWELLWGWCCYSGLFLCASGHPFSSHLLQTLAVESCSCLLAVLSLLHRHWLPLCCPLFGAVPSL